MYIPKGRGFSLIELLIAFSIIALVSSMVFAAVSSVRKKARDTQRIASARQLSFALEQFDQSNNTYRIANTGLNDSGGGYVMKGAESSGYTNSIVESLKASGFYSASLLKDPIYGTENYYLGVCTSTNAYNVFLKVEQPELQNSTSTILGACDGVNALSNGFNYVAYTVGGNSGGAADPNTYKESTGVVFTASTGVLDSSFSVGTGMDVSVLYSMFQADGKILVGGGFTTINGVTRNRIARLNTDGSIDNSFNSTNGANSFVYGIDVQPDGKILIAGQFTSYGVTTRNRIARLNPDGSLDTSFDTSVGASDMVRSVKVLPDGKILIAGYFGTVNGYAYSRIARLNSDGTVDTSFTTGSGISGGGATVNYMTTQSDGKILIAGNFTAYNGTTRNYFARLNADGTLDTSFAPTSGPNSWSYRILPLSDGKILLGGNYTTYNGTSRNYLARINSDGSLDTSFNTGAGGNGWVYSISEQPDSKLIIAGNFTTFGGSSRGYVARLNSDGSLDTSFNPGTGANGTVYSSLIAPDGKVYFSGNFTSYAGTSINRMIKVK